MIITLLLLSSYISLSLGACSGIEGTLCTTPTTFQDRRLDKTQLSIATFNAEWLFWDDLNNGPSTKCPANHTQGTCPWQNQTRAEAHLQAIAVKIAALNADIINLVEVLDCVVLQCLINAIGDSSYKPYLIKGKDTGTDQNVGLITRIDPLSPLFRNELRATINASNSSCGYPNDTTSGVSKHYIARFNIDNIGNITFIGAHFVAFPVDDQRCIQREAQATVIKKIAQLERDNGSAVVILGDFNDYDKDIPDASNSVPTSSVLKLLKYDDSGNRIMYNVIEKVNKTSRYSNWWDKNDNCKTEAGELTEIDHLLVSPSLYDRIKSVTIENIVLQECETLQSDHYPIKIILESSNTAPTPQPGPEPQPGTGPQPGSGPIPNTVPSVPNPTPNIDPNIPNSNPNPNPTPTPTPNPIGPEIMPVPSTDAFVSSDPPSLAWITAPVLIVIIISAILLYVYFKRYYTDCVNLHPNKYAWF